MRALFWQREQAYYNYYSLVRQNKFLRDLNKHPHIYLSTHQKRVQSKERRRCLPLSNGQGHRHRSAKVAKEQSLDNLWLAQILFDLGGVQFGNFTVSESAVSSPVFVNPKVLISNPTALRVASKLMQQEINLAQSLRRPRVHPFTLVAGVPVGGLLLAMSYSLETNIPMIYARIRPEGTGTRGIEGRYSTGDTALIFDDLITRGSSVLETAKMLESDGIKVKDVIVLIDREHGAAEHLRHHGYNLMSILKLDVMLTHYMSKGLISEETYRTCAEYLRSKQDEDAAASDA